MWTRLIAASLLVILPGSGHAADDSLLNSPLRGITRFTLLIEDLSPDAARCQITEQLIRDSFLYPVSSSKIAVTGYDAFSDDPRMYIAVLTSENRGCISKIDIQAYQQQSVTIKASNKTAFANVELWKAGGLISGRYDSHARQMREGIEGFAKQFITAWNLA